MLKTIIVFVLSISVYFNFYSSLIFYFCITLTGSIITSLGEYNSGAVSFYPNPVNDVINFSANINPLKVVVYDLLGNIVAQTEPENNSVSVSFLAGGIYFLELIAEKKTLFQRFVKN